MWRSAVLLTLLLTGPAFAQATSPRLEPLSCDEEKECLAKLQGKANRKGMVLSLKLKNGKSTKFEDSRNCETNEENCVTYVLQGYRPAQGIYLVSWSGWEDAGIAVVSAQTGEAKKFSDAPDFSPSGNAFVVAGGNYERQVTIWSIREGVIRRELLYDYESPEGSESWSVLGWDGDNRVRLRVSPVGTNNEVETDAVLEAQGWVLNWPFPK